MAYSDDAAEQVVKIALEGTEVAARITGAGAKQVAILLYAVLKDQKRTKGKTRLTTMLRSGKALKVFAVQDKDLEKFCRQAKKYGVLYCVLKDRDAKDGITEIMVKAEDASKINRIFERNQLTTVDMASVRSEIERSMQDRDTTEDIPEPERPAPSRSKEDVFLDALLASPNQEKTQTENPTQARAAKSSPSAPSSMPSDVGIERQERKPSVRQEMKEIRAELEEAKRKTDPPRRSQPHRAPQKKKSKKKER